MDILFMGTPDFAAASLKVLIQSRHNVVGVVTQPDKPKGRGHKLTPPEVKVIALENDIEVYQPVTLRNGELEDILKKLNPDLIAVVAYGKILPKYIIDFPKYGCVNVHGSLLPKYRGAAPIQWSVINGDEVTGVTTMLMDEGLDTGDMLLTQEVTIGEYETSEELFDRLAPIGGELLVKTIDALENESVTPIKQDDDKSSYASLIKKEMGMIDWSKTAGEISKLICGMNSWPLAYTHYKGEVLKIVSAVYDLDEDVNGEVGQIIEYVKKKGLKIKCGSGVLYIQTAQFTGSKKMNIDDYLRGHQVDIGEVLK